MGPPTELVQIGVDVAVHYVLDGGGAIARRAGPALARVLRRRFGGGSDHLLDAPDLTTSKEHLRAFAVDLDARVTSLETTREITEERLNELFARPGITGALNDAFEAAIETDNVLARATLADLVVDRLRAADDAPEGPALRIAIERMRDVTPRQIRLITLTAVLKSERFNSRAPMSDEQREAYAAWVERALAPFAQIPLIFSDFAHIRGLGLLFFDDSDGGFTTTGSLPLLYSALPPGSTRPTDPRVTRAISALAGDDTPHSRTVTINNVVSCTLTPAGAMIARNALRELTGLEL